jgi:hypothetical protein
MIAELNEYGEVLRRAHRLGVPLIEKVKVADLLDGAAVEIDQLREHVAELEMALWLVRCYGCPGETHDGYSVSYFIGKLLTDEIGRAANARYAKWVSDQRDDS